MKKIVTLGSFMMAVSICCMMLAAVTYGQTSFPPDSVVKQRCGACHKPDEQGRLEVLEETRKSPEEWKAVIIRMRRLNSAPVEDAEFDAAVKELSGNLCLTPAEMARVAYYNSDENSQHREIPKDDLETRIYTACVRCHTFGKIASHRMTPAQWGENRNLHLGYYPTVVGQMREMDWAKESESLIEPVAKLFPFDTPEWKKWMKTRKDQDLTGQWRIAGYQPAMGYYEGTCSFKANPGKGADEYIVERDIRYEGGTAMKMKGQATLYGEYHLRYEIAPTPLTGRIEGVFDLDADKMTFSGKWWTVIQDSNAYGNEKFCKADEMPRIIGLFPQSLKSGLEQKLTLIGAGLPGEIAEPDIQFSDSNVKVKKIVTMDHSKIVCMVEVGEVPNGTLTMKVKDIAYENPVTVFDKIDGIKIFPPIGRARVRSGAAYPPQGVQFVARAVNFGPDGKPDTTDDMFLEQVDAEWGLEEESTREKDDDLKYLDAPVTNGLYTPVTTYGPIEERHQRREGIGLIAINASCTLEGKTFKSRALLAVTVPDFITHIK